MSAPRSDVAFSPAVKALQTRAGSRAAYARRDFGDVLPPPLVDFVHARDSLYLSTASADGQPYIQHRGGAPGFLTALDPATLAFADYAGNRQYISVGNLSENDCLMMFLMDYPNRRRLKIWGRGVVVDDLDAWDGPDLTPALAASAGERVERLVVVHITAWDLNCPKHITPRYSARELAALENR